MQDTPEVLIEGYFENHQLAERFLFEGIAELPERVRPTHYGDGERPRKSAKNEISDAVRYRQFVRDNLLSFFLYGPGCSFSSTPMNVELEFGLLAPIKRFDPSLGKPIMEVLARYGAVYSFGADWEEYEERNGYTLQFVDKRTAHGFLGRDFRRYVPGLYWLNYFSDGYRDSMGIDAADLAMKLGGSVSTSPGGTFLQLYDKPTDWRKRNDEVCPVIDETENLFSKHDVEFPSGITQKEYITTDASLFSRDWPW